MWLLPDVLEECGGPVAGLTHAVPEGPQENVCKEIAGGPRRNTSLGQGKYADKRQVGAATAAARALGWRPGPSGGGTQPAVWAWALLRRSHVTRRPRFFRRAAIRLGGRGWARAGFNPPAPLPFPFALVSRT